MSRFLQESHGRCKNNARSSALCAVKKYQENVASAQIVDRNETTIRNKRATLAGPLAHRQHPQTDREPEASWMQSSTS
jgi:hypothetical protein